MLHLNIVPQEAVVDVSFTGYGKPAIGLPSYLISLIISTLVHVTVFCSRTHFLSSKLLQGQ